MANTEQIRSVAAFQRGAVRPQPKKGRSQAHSGVSPLHPVSHRNTSFQPLPRPLGWRVTATTWRSLFLKSPRR